MRSDFFSPDELLEGASAIMQTLKNSKRKSPGAFTYNTIQ